jgi:DNA topoisomerase-1
MFTVTLDQAKELFAQPKPRGRAGRAAAAPPLRELGDDPDSSKPIVLREGRFGPYVTDGETNASLRKGDAPESITLQRAVELLAERRAAAPAPRRASGSRARSGGAGGSSPRASSARPRKAPAKRSGSKNAGASGTTA